ncbi:MAG: hypothetical protein WC419_00870 [Candidatus Omnitrophota bacterium]|jgi:hypothetical protein|nr:hypothetical protein [Candidatus Omnitrophota bacterium]
MSPDIFESLMLVCFGAAWPFSIYKMIKTKKAHGKSLSFLIVILMGYISGIAFEYFGERNDVMFLYLLNTLMVTIDLILTIRYKAAQ